MNGTEAAGDFIAEELRRALRDYLSGDCAETVFALSRERFEAWADGIELPFASVSRMRTPEDGIFVLPDAEGWIVLEQTAGAYLPGAQTFASYRAAKRAALKLALPAILGIVRRAK